MVPPVQAELFKVTVNHLEGQAGLIKLLGENVSQDRIPSSRSLTPQISDRSAQDHLHAAHLHTYIHAVWAVDFEFSQIKNPHIAKPNVL